MLHAPQSWTADSVGFQPRNGGYKQPNPDGKLICLWTEGGHGLDGEAGASRAGWDETYVSWTEHGPVKEELDQELCLDLMQENYLGELGRGNQS